MIDTIKPFARTRLIVDPTARTATWDLHHTYSDWCDRAGVTPLKPKAFTRALRGLIRTERPPGVRYKRIRVAGELEWGVVGLALRPVGEYTPLEDGLLATVDELTARHCTHAAVTRDLLRCAENYKWCRLRAKKLIIDQGYSFADLIDERC